MNNNTTTTNNNIRRHRSMGLLLAAGTVALLTFTACSASQRRALGEQDVRDSIVSHVKQAVSDQSLSLGDGLDCTSTIDASSHVSASCVGTARSGQPVTASFTGTADIDKETCTAVLVVDIDGTRVIDQPYVQCFDSV
jgi:hypothetical protein